MHGEERKDGAERDGGRPLAGPARTDAERLWTMAAHLAGAFVSLAGPLAVRLLRGERASAWERDSVRHALAYQGVVFAAWLVTLPLVRIPCVGWIPNALVLVTNAVLCLIAGIHAYDGKAFRYPVAWPWPRDPVA